MTHETTAKPAGGFVWREDDAVITPEEAHRPRRTPDHEPRTRRPPRLRPMCI
jgi:hypothetical protein